MLRARAAGLRDALLQRLARKGLDGAIGGMALSHAMLAACVGWLGYGVVRGTEAPESASQERSSRVTSATTAG